MFATNVGGIDRILRIVIGAALILAFFLTTSQSPWRYAYLLGIVPLATGILKTCPIYTILGMNTCPAKKS